MTFGVRITRGIPGQSVTTEGSFYRVSCIPSEAPEFVKSVKISKRVKAYLHKPQSIRVDDHTHLHALG